MTDTKPRAVIFDLDGTLAESKQPMSPSVAELLVQLPLVAVMTGAGWAQIEKQFLSAFPQGTDLSNVYIFPDNGAQCFIYKDGTWNEQYSMVFSPEEASHITTVLINEIEEVNFPQPAETWGKQIENRGAQISFSALGQQAPLEAKKQWRAEHDADRTYLRDVLAEKLPNYSVRTGGETTIDITKKGITKAYGIQRFSELTSIPVSDMVYVGDALQEGGNDSVVIETGVRTQAVSGPQETVVFIEQLIS